jgi:hypothetical protein
VIGRRRCLQATERQAAGGFLTGRYYGV